MEQGVADTFRTEEKMDTDQIAVGRTDRVARQKRSPLVVIFHRRTSILVLETKYILTT